MSRLFRISGIRTTSRYGKAAAEATGIAEGTALTVDFELDGQVFTALNGGPQFTPNPSVSFFVYCRTKEEADSLWNRLSEGGMALMPLGEYPFSPWYGWVQDRFGVSWQVNFAENGFSRRFVPSLLFVGGHYGRAREAIAFYTSVFRDSQRGTLVSYGADQPPDREGAVQYADFQIEGQQFIVMDSALEHQFDFNEAVSFLVNCRDQEEVDYYWNRLSAVPEAEACGWLKDKFGISWQIVPVILGELMSDPDTGRSERVTRAMLRMKKIDIRTLQQAYENI